MSRISLALIIGAIVIIGVLETLAITYVLITGDYTFVAPYIIPIMYPWIYMPLM